MVKFSLLSISGIGHLRFIVGGTILFTTAIIDANRFDGPPAAPSGVLSSISWNYIKVIGMFAKYFLNGFYFRNISYRSRGSVHINIVDILRSETCINNSQPASH
jgi:hypothetical protein